MHIHKPNPGSPSSAMQSPLDTWAQVRIHLFHLDGKDYLVTVHYFSSFYELDRLSTMTSSEVIGKLKQHFGRHGVRERMISDNGPPYNSQEFQDFAKTYSYGHVTSLPGYSQSNEKAENTVKLAKGLLQKASQSKNGPHLALLDWWNAPSEILGTSPAQRLFCLRTRTLLPTSVSLLKQEVATDTVPKLETQEAKQANYYNSTALELKELKEDDLVWM